MKKILLILFFIPFNFSLFANDSLYVNYSIQKKFDYFFLEAIRQKEKNKHTNAFTNLQHALAINPNSSAALYELADYYFFLQRDSLAITTLEKAVSNSPENFEYKVALATANREFGKTNEAVVIYEELVKEYPNKPELNFFLSELYLRLQKIDKAIESLDALENNVGMSEALSLQKYNLYNLVDQKERGIQEIEKLAEKFPMEAKYQIIIGDTYLEAGEPEKALVYYEKAHRIDPKNPYYVVSMANYYEYTEEFEKATQEIEKALKNPLLDVETKIAILGRYIGNLLQSNKDVESANALFETLMEQHSQEKELNLMYGQFLLSQNKLEEAKFQFQVVTEATPEDIMAWRQLLNLALRENKMDDVIKICDAALIHFPEAPEFYFYKGAAYYQEEDYQKALEVYLEGIKIVPEEDKTSKSNFYGQIGDLYHQLGEKEKSYEAYDISLQHNENNYVVLNNYAYFLSLEKIDLDKAERMSSKCVKAQPENFTYIDTYAWIFFQKGNYTLAKFYIENAISNGGEKSPDILEHYGDILYKTGNTEKAVQEWEKALVLKAENGNTDLLQKKIDNKTYYE